MNPLSNPFVIGKYVDKDYFCDREKRACRHSAGSPFGYQYSKLTYL